MPAATAPGVTVLHVVGAISMAGPSAIVALNAVSLKRLRMPRRG